MIFETAHFTASQARSYRLPGYVIVESKADVDRLDALSEEAQRDLVRCLAKAEHVVRELTSPERVYTLRFGEVQPRIHFHVIPRTARVGTAFAAGSGEASESGPFDGAMLVAWLWRNHASLGHTDAELAAFVAAARTAARA